MKKLVCCVLIGLMFYSCVKDYPDVYYHLNKVVDKLGNFKKESYWIYRNDSLNLIDTISVINNQMRQRKENDDSGYSYTDEISITLKSSYSGSLIYDFLSAPCNYKRTYQDNSNDGFGLAVYDPLDFPFGGSIDYSYNYQLNGIRFDTVLIYKNSEQNMYVFSLDCGILKMTKNYKTNKIEWNLIKYKIVR